MILKSDVQVDTIILQHPSKHEAFVYHLYSVGPTSSTLVQRCINVIQVLYVYCPTNTRHSTNVALMLAHRLRLWANIKSTLVQRLVLTGMCEAVILYEVPER